MCDTMATKKGAGGEPQEYDTSTGQYGSGKTFRQNATYSEILQFFAKKSEAGWKNGEGKIYYEIIPSSGDVRFHKYDEKTRRMISIDTDGTVHTFMRPNTKAYFYNYKRSFNLREYTKD